MRRLVIAAALLAAGLAPAEAQQQPQAGQPEALNRLFADTFRWIGLAVNCSSQAAFANDGQNAQRYMVIAHALSGQFGMDPSMLPRMRDKVLEELRKNEQPGNQRHREMLATCEHFMQSYREAARQFNEQMQRQGVPQ